MGNSNNDAAVELVVCTVITFYNAIAGEILGNLVGANKNATARELV